jgi:hypothetical protein
MLLEEEKRETYQLLVFSSAEEKIESVFSAGRAALSCRDTADDAETRVEGRHPREAGKGM